MRQDRNHELRATSRKRSQPSFGRRAEKSTRGGLGRMALFVVFTAAVFATLTAWEPPLGVQLGQPSPRDFEARVSFTRTDLQRTEAARAEARRNEPAVFYLTADQWEQNVSALMRAIHDGPRAQLWRTLPEGIEQDALERILRELDSRRDAVRAALEGLAELYLVAPEDLQQPVVRTKKAEKVVLRDSSGASRMVPLSALVPLKADSERFKAALAQAFEDMNPQDADAARRLLAHGLRPNVVLDLEQTRQNAERAAQDVQPVTEGVGEGTLILARGSRVTPQHIEDLRSERRQYSQSRPGRMLRLQRCVGLGVLLLIVMGGATAYAKRQRPDLLEVRAQLLSFMVLTVGLVATARLCLAHGVSPLWVPVPLTVMIMCLVYDQAFGVGVAFFHALLVRLACPGADTEFLVLLTGGTIAALLTGQVRTRSTLILAGGLTGAVQFCAVWGLGFMSPPGGGILPIRFWQSPLFSQSLAALANGISSGFIVSGILPLIEKLFGVTTDIRLLEWSDPNQPLLQRLLLDAPGSYHHSMVVGSLAAEAAEAVGANPLLARVSAYFHDVGKLKKPEYFAENLPQGAQNPHDDLSPTMSSLIITAHPKEGAEMAAQYGVPKEVCDIILQSHGSSVVKYFWGKARNGQKEADGVQEKDFRYRLPKPRSKEAAIVMLCDAVESAARSLKSPSASQLRDLVHSIIMDRLHDGQLDESTLTITDLKRIEETLVRGLGAVFHNRVSYPGQERLEGGQSPAADAENARSEKV